MSRSIRAAVIQHPPVYLDLGASLARAVDLVAEAKRGGASLVAFPETYLPGYPAWIWRLRPGSDMALCKEIHARLFANSVDVEAGQLAPLCDAAREHAVTIACGINERDGRFSRSTLYNTFVTIGPDGEISNLHRKLIPTNPERMVWGFGDASGLRVVPTPVGRIGTLICWENLMPLARHVLYAEGVELYIAPTWDCGETWLASMRHIAREAGCWVLGCAAAVQARDLPVDLPDRARLYPDDEEWLCSGDSVVMAPAGGPVAGPLHRQRGIVYADCDLDRVADARRSLDPAGHYFRPDVFRLEVNRARSGPIRFDDSEPH
jgi:nitrilase